MGRQPEFEFGVTGIAAVKAGMLGDLFVMFCERLGFFENLLISIEHDYVEIMQAVTSKKERFRVAGPDYTTGERVYYFVYNEMNIWESADDLYKYVLTIPWVDEHVDHEKLSMPKDTLKRNRLGKLGAVLFSKVAAQSGKVSDVLDAATVYMTYFDDSVEGVVLNLEGIVGSNNIAYNFSISDSESMVIEADVDPDDFEPVWSNIEKLSDAVRTKLVRLNNG